MVPPLRRIDELCCPIDRVGKMSSLKFSKEALRGRKRMSCNDWITAVVKGNTFADVGGLWGTLNEKVSVAAKAGAVKTAMVDMQPMNNELWQKFYERCFTEGVTCDSAIEANIDDPDFPDKVGTYDVVHCAGVIYHCPNPLYTISQLSKVTSKIFILGTIVIQPHIKNSKGEMVIEAGGGLFVPALNDRQREVVATFFREVGASEMFGIDPPIEKKEWSLDNYSPWWWLFTPDCVPGLLAACGFTLESTYSEWGGRVSYYLAKRR